MENLEYNSQFLSMKIEWGEKYRMIFISKNAFVNEVLTDIDR